MIGIVVITHGEFGAYLIEAAEGIVGRQEAVVSLSISPRASIDEVRRKLDSVLAGFSGAGGVLLAVDMPGGTPCNVAMRAVKDRENMRVVSGVNLYMLVTAFSCRREASLREVSEKMIEAGRKAIADIHALLESRK